MWALVVLIIPICGYLYIDHDLYLKYKFKNISGWHAYFMAASQGIFLTVDMIASVFSVFVVFFFTTLVLFLVLGVVDGVVGAFTSEAVFFSGENFNIFMSRMTDFGIGLYGDFVIFFFNIIKDHFTANKAAGVICVMLAVFTFLEISKNQRVSRRSKAREMACKDSKAESMLYQAEQSGSLIMFTLKSRKVYVGQIIGEEVSYTDKKEIAIIPFLSGYRDKDTLSFKVEHDYSKHYRAIKLSEGEDLSKNLQQVIFTDQIETMSLFDVGFFKSLQSEIKE